MSAVPATLSTQSEPSASKSRTSARCFALGRRHCESAGCRKRVRTTQPRSRRGLGNSLGNMKALTSTPACMAFGLVSPLMDFLVGDKRASGKTFRPVVTANLRRLAGAYGDGGPVGSRSNSSTRDTGHKWTVVKRTSLSQDFNPFTVRVWHLGNSSPRWA